MTSAATSRATRRAGLRSERRGRDRCTPARRGAAPAPAAVCRPGAPASRGTGWADSTSRTTIRASPSAAPPNTVSSARSSAGVAAPVAGERGVGVGLPDGVEVADDVRAAEGVDRLLGVADQDQRDVPVRSAAGCPTAAGRCPGTRRPAPPGSGPAAAAPPPRTGSAERVVQAGDAGRRRCAGRAPACGARPRRARPSRRTGAPRRCRLAPGGLEAGLRVADRPAGQPQRLGAVERGRARAAWRRTCARRSRRRPRRPGRPPTRRTPRRRRRRRCRAPVSICPQNWWVVAMVAASNSASAAVSRRRRSAASASGTSASSAATGSVPARAAAGSRSAALGAHQPLADPLAQFLGGLAAEGDEQQLRQRGRGPRRRSGRRARRS